MLRLLFLSCFGFTGGVLYLLFFLVPFEQWLADRGTSQGVVDVVLAALVFGWLVIGLCATDFSAGSSCRAGGTFPPVSRSWVP